MAKLNKEQADLLHKIYYDQNFMFGRDKLYQYVRKNYPDADITRRALWEWLSAQEINQLHRPHQAARSLKSTLMKRPGQQLAIDLIDMQHFEKGGFNYILNTVDLFSRKVYAIALKNKEAETVLAGFKKIMRDVGSIGSVRSDNGSEFIAAPFKEYLDSEGIAQVLSKPALPQSNGGIERQNQTLKRLIHKAIEHNEAFDWPKQLNKLVDNLNATVIDKRGNHTPDEIQGGAAEVIEKVHDLDKKAKTQTLAVQAFKKGDRVRHFLPSERMKSRQWSPDIYTVAKVFKPRTGWGIYEYQLDAFKTKFKHEDLQLITDLQNEIDEPEKFVIAKLLRRIERNGRVYFEVKWKGYKEPTIEPRDSLIEDVPKMIKQFENKM
jgi:transposase InsO family protein